MGESGLFKNRTCRLTGLICAPLNEANVAGFDFDAGNITVAKRATARIEVARVCFYGIIAGRVFFGAVLDACF